MLVMQAQIPETTPAQPLGAMPNPYEAPDYGRPLDTLLAGGGVALGTFAAIVVIVYKTWYLHQVDENLAILIAGFLFFVYTGAVWIFSYAWERGDAAKAIRLTVVVVVLSAVAVLLLAVAFAVMTRARGAVSMGSGDSATTTTGGGGIFGVGGILRTAGSYVGSGRLEAEPEPAPSELSTIACEQCGARYIPVPPKALCPYCGWAAVSSAA
jgi:hypothetical protein